MIPRSANCRDRDRTAEEFDMPDPTCQYPGCTCPLPYRGRGRPRKWCDRHTKVVIAEAKLGKPHVSTTRLCEVPGCRRSLAGRGLCQMHWRRWARETGQEKPPAWDEKRRAAWKARYAAKRGVESEKFEFVSVFERDGWVCGICGESVDSALAYPDPLSVSLDHVVPLSKGGSHTLDNVQCSHLECNLRKCNDFETA